MFQHNNLFSSVSTNLEYLAPYYVSNSRNVLLGKDHINDVIFGELPFHIKPTLFEVALYI